MADIARDWVRELQRIMARLRAPDGCPWDREQDHRTLTRYLVEEAYEFIDAIESGDDQQMVDELGDLLLQVVFHCQIAQEESRFDLQDAARACCEKMVRRHPHVFGDAAAADADAVVRQWEQIKARERGGSVGDSALAGVPRGFPALVQAQKIQKKAAKVGFDWPDTAGPREKILEELAEIDAAPDAAALAAEVGDLLFAVVNLARKLNIDAESALRGTTARFMRRFAHMEAAFAADGIRLAEDRPSLTELDAAWDRAKEAERSN